MGQKGIIGIFVLILILAIAVAGGAYYLGRVTTKPQVTETQQPVQVTPTPDPTANWKTYTNSEQSFSVKYPEEWLIHIGKLETDPRFGYAAVSPQVTFQPGDNNTSPYITINVSGNHDNLPLISYVKSYVIYPDKFQFENFIVKGEQAIRTHFPYSTYDPQDTLIFIMHDQLIYTLLLSHGADGKHISSDVFMQILSTFKFTSQ